MAPPDPPRLFRFRDFELDVAGYQLRRNRRPVRLERQPMDLLILLVANRQRLVTRAEIVDSLWGKDVFVDVETGVHTAIRKIRQALHDSAETPVFVETVAGKGYRFIAPVEVAPAAPGPPAAQEPESPVAAGPSSPAVATAAVSAPVARRRTRAVLIACGLILVAVAPWLYVSWRTTARVSELQFKGDFHRIRWEEAEIRKGIAYFNRAIAIDPGTVDAYHGLASAWLLMSDLHVSPREAIPHAREATMQVLRRDEASVQAHVSLGVIKMQYDWDFAGADQEFGRALELDPRESDALLLRGWLRMAVGQLADAQADLRRAVEADPSDMNLWSFGLSFYFDRQYEAAVEQYRRAIAAEPQSHWAHQSLGWAYERQGRLADAITELEASRRLLDTPQVVASLVHAQAAAGRQDEAEATMASLLEYAQRKYVSPYDLAVASAGLGDRTQALAWLEKAYEERSGWLALWLKIDPTFDSMRDDGHFRDLLKRVGHTP
jgi:DNA-binding winged helix-turn-helix (wHTH) protein/tetratricopeptide (TPR) repeat protein